MSGGQHRRSAEDEPPRRHQRDDGTDAADPRPTPIRSSAGRVAVAVALGRIHKSDPDEGPRGREVRVVLPQRHRGPLAEGGSEELGFPLPQLAGPRRLAGQQHPAAVEDAHAHPAAGREIQERRHQRRGRRPHSLEGGDHLGGCETAGRSIRGRSKRRTRVTDPASRGQGQADHRDDGRHAQHSPDDRAATGQRPSPGPDVLGDRLRECRGWPCGSAREAGGRGQLNRPERHVGARCDSRALRVSAVGTVEAADGDRLDWPGELGLRVGDGDSPAVADEVPVQLGITALTPDRLGIGGGHRLQRTRDLVLDDVLVDPGDELVRIADPHPQVAALDDLLVRHCPAVHAHGHDVHAVVTLVPGDAARHTGGCPGRCRAERSGAKSYSIVSVRVMVVSARHERCHLQVADLLGGRGGCQGHQHCQRQAGRSGRRSCEAGHHVGAASAGG